MNDLILFSVNIIGCKTLFIFHIHVLIVINIALQSSFVSVVWFFYNSGHFWEHIHIPVITLALLKGK